MFDLQKKIASLSSTGISRSDSLDEDDVSDISPTLPQVLVPRSSKRYNRIPYDKYKMFAQELDSFQNYIDHEEDVLHTRTAERIPSLPEDINRNLLQLQVFVIFCIFTMLLLYRFQ